VALPDLSNAAEQVQARIRERHAAMTAVVSRRDAAPKDRAAAYGEMGKLFIAAEYLDAAEACFANARVLDAADMRWPYFLGHVFRARNDPAKAASSFEQALALSPEHVPSLVWLAEMQIAQSRPDVAGPLLARARSLQPNDGAVLFGLGRVALAKQDYAQAVTHLEGALALAPEASRIRYPLALAYRGVGRRDKAEEHLRLRGEVDLPSADPLLGEISGLLQNASAYEVRGSQAIDDRRWADAVTSLRKAIELAPDNPFSRLNLATSLYMQGDADGALEQYRAAIRLSPDLARAHFGIGVLMETRGRDPEAIEAFTAAVMHDQAYVEARFSLANALRRSGRVRQSLPHYEEVIRTNPAVSQASFGYAMGLVRVGRYQDARDRLEQGMRVFPDQLGFAHALARLLAAAPDDRVRDGTRALSIMEGLVEAEQTLAMAETMAMALAELGRFEDAVNWQRDVMAAAAKGRRQDLAGRLSANLRLYQNSQPCRVPWADDDPVHRPGGSR
jgi:tetratricopeptide (TPR) repeat protein